MIKIKTPQSMMKAVLISVLLLPSLNGMVAEDVLAEEAIAETSIISQLLRDKSTPLHIAAYFDRVAKIEQLLEEGAALGARDKNGATALHIAAKRGNLGAVQSLILHARQGTREMKVDVQEDDTARYAIVGGKRAAEGFVPHTKRERGFEVYDLINMPDNSGASALYYATVGRKLSVIQCLLENGAISYGLEIIIAAQNGDLPALQCIMSMRALNAHPVHFNSALLYAAKSGSVPVIEFLIQAGESVSVRGDDGRTPLLVAAQHGHIDAVNCLLRHGANCWEEKDNNAKGMLHYAAQGGHVAMIDFVLDLGWVNINSQCRLLQTPILLAVMNGHTEATDLLMRRGANVSTFTMGQFMKMAAESGNVKLLGLLLMRWKDAPTMQGLVLIAARGNNVRMLELLQQHGAPISGCAEPLTVAVEAGHLETTRFLLQNGAEIDCYMLSAAADKGFVGIMELLLEFGAKIDEGNNWLPSPLCTAASTGHAQAVQFLIGKGASVVESEHGCPLGHAIQYSEPDVTPQHLKSAKLLLKAGAPVRLELLEDAGTLAALRMMINAHPECIENIRGERTFEELLEGVKRASPHRYQHPDCQGPFVHMPNQVRSMVQQYFMNREFYLANGRFKDEDNLDALFEVAAYFLAP